MGKGTAAVGGVVLATGLIGGMGGTAFANTSHAPEPAPNTDNAPAAPEQHTTKSDAPDKGRDLVGVNAPVALDLHDGVANNLHAHDVARGVAVVGDVVPAGQDAPAPQAKSDQGGTHTTSASTDAKSSQGGKHAQQDQQQESTPGEGLQPVKPVAGVVKHVDQTVNASVHSVVDAGQQLNPMR